MVRKLRERLRSLVAKFRGKKRPPAVRPPSEITGPKIGYLDAQLNGWHRQDLGELATGFPIGPEDTVVDVGCGDGGASAFAAALGAEVIATDIDPQSIARVEKKLRRSKARAYQALVSDSNPLPLPDASATRVICQEVLEHVDDPKKFLAELVRIGKPGALYLLSVPDMTGELLQKKLAPPAYWERPNHLRIFSRNDFDQLVREGGLHIEVKSYKSFFWALWWVFFWVSDHDLGAPEGPILANWTRTWNALLKAPKGEQVREVLDEFMPKAQVICARKKAA